MTVHVRTKVSCFTGGSNDHDDRYGRKKVFRASAREGKPEWGLRIRIGGRRLLRMSYELGWERTSSRRTTTSSRRAGIKVYIDKNSAAYLTGSEIDFVQNDMMGPASPSRIRTSSHPAGCGQSHRF